MVLDLHLIDYNSGRRVCACVYVSVYVCAKPSDCGKSDGLPGWRAFRGLNRFGAVGETIFLLSTPVRRDSD